MVPQGSQSLALGLAKTAASQLDEFVRAHPFFLGKAMAFALAAVEFLYAFAGCFTADSKQIGSTII